MVSLSNHRRLEEGILRQAQDEESIGLSYFAIVLYILEGR